jgi:hypothetical protein
MVVDNGPSGSTDALVRDLFKDNRVGSLEADFSSKPAEVNNVATASDSDSSSSDSGSDSDEDPNEQSDAKPFEFEEVYTAISRAASRRASGLNDGTTTTGRSNSSSSLASSVTAAFARPVAIATAPGSGSGSGTPSHGRQATPMPRKSSAASDLLAERELWYLRRFVPRIVMDDHIRAAAAAAAAAGEEQPGTVAPLQQPLCSVFRAAVGLFDVSGEHFE